MARLAILHCSHRKQCSHQVNLYLSPVSRLRPVCLTDPGRVTSVTGWCFTAGSLPARLAQQMATAAREHLQQADCAELAGAKVWIYFPSPQLSANLDILLIFD